MASAGRPSGAWSLEVLEHVGNKTFATQALTAARVMLGRDATHAFLCTSAHWRLKVCNHDQTRN